MLHTPVESLPLPAETRNLLVGLGFTTVGMALRACLMGRLSARDKKKEQIEKQVLNAACQFMGRPLIDRDYFKKCIPENDEETIGQALSKLYGQSTELPASFTNRTIREILFPTGIHNITGKLGINTIGELLRCRMSGLLKCPGIGPKLLGDILALTFDYLFIKNDPFPPPPQPTPVVEPYAAKSKPSLGQLDWLLIPWFSEKVLRAARKFLERLKKTKILFYRNGVGALFSGEVEGQVMLKFEEDPKATAEFKITHPRCYICGVASKDQGFCKHAAALAIMTLGDLGEDETYHPLPFLFARSPWKLIGNYLFEYLGRVGYESLVLNSAGPDLWQMTVPDEGGDIIFSLLLEKETLRACVSIYEKSEYSFGLILADDRDDQLQELYARLAARCRTETEIDLNAHEQKSRGQERHESIWFWIAGQLFVKVPAHHLEVSRREDGVFELLARGEHTNAPRFYLALERVGTPELMMGLGMLGIGPAPLKPAKAFMRICFDEDGAALKIIPCLRLADGRVFTRVELEAMRYGKAYWLSGEGFLPVREGETVLKDVGPGGEITRIPTSAVPAFMAKNREAIYAQENEADESLTNFRVCEVPERLEVLGGRMDDEWCYLAGMLSFGKRKVGFDQLFYAREKGEELLPGKGVWVKLAHPELEWFYKLGTQRLWRDQEDKCIGIRLTRQELLRLQALGPKLVFADSGHEASDLRRFLGLDLRPEALNIPGDMPDHLRAYQRNGLAWLWYLFSNNLGGILADDMGLGKTHQALGLISMAKSGCLPGKRFLVVCPATVVSHWTEKIDHYYPGLSWYIFHGNKRDLEEARDSYLLITTYGILRRDIESLAKIPFDIIILDEIQSIKNKKTDVHAAARQLNGKVMIGLSGTPLENSVCDLKALLDVCVPGFLGSDSWFKRNFIIPIEEYGDRRASAKLSRLINPFLLRRTREQVLPELPEVIEDVRYCTLTDDQVALYREVLEGQGAQLFSRISVDKKNGALPYIEILAVITMLKQICDHPALLNNGKGYDLLASGKWELFTELLEMCLDSGIKVVVFSHYTRMLDIIAKHLERQNIPYAGIRGNMSLAVRKEEIRRFNTVSTCRVFCASLLAGGVGVDLTSAQAVIHYDRWWNAAREDQATARVHRMGQKQVVQVFKLLTRDTVEEKIHTLIEKKRTLAKELIRKDDAGIIKRLSRAEIIEILRWGKEGIHS